MASEDLHMEKRCVEPTQSPPTRLCYGPGPSQFILVRLPLHTSPPATASLPLAVILHGGFWKGEYGLDPPTAAIEGVAPTLLSRGIATAEVEYRRSLDDQWGVGFTDADVAAAYGAVSALPYVDEARVIVVGHSAGGLLALSLLLGGNSVPEPALVVALAPVADLCRAAKLRLSDDGDAVQRYMRGEPEEKEAEYRMACPACRSAELAGRRVVVVAGSEDEDVPSDYVREFYRKVGGKEGWEMMEMNGANHYDIVNGESKYWSWTLEIILKSAFPTRQQTSAESQRAGSD